MSQEKRPSGDAGGDPLGDLPPIGVPKSSGSADPPPLVSAGESDADSELAPKLSVDTRPSEDGLEPRIIRDGLIDAILDWVRDYCDQLARTHAPSTVLEQAKEDLGVMVSLRHDLICLERSIELVGREKAQALIERAGAIRAQIISLYEGMAGAL